jgi:hypothetical protein
MEKCAEKRSDLAVSGELQEGDGGPWSGVGWVRQGMSLDEKHWPGDDGKLHPEHQNGWVLATELKWGLPLRAPNVSGVNSELRSFGGQRDCQVISQTRFLITDITSSVQTADY